MKEGRPNDLSDLERKADARWYQGAGLAAYDPADYAQTFDQCANGDCDPWRVGGAVVPFVSGGLLKKAGPELVEKLGSLPSQIHHIASNKNPQWIGEFTRITERFGLDLDGAWNKITLPHKRGWSGGGGHPDQYHEWVLEEMRDIAKEAGDSTNKFLELWGERVRDIIESNPEMLFEEWWE